MTQPSIEEWLRSATRRRVTEFTAQLRSVGDSSTAVPNLDWTVAELGQHVASMASHFQRLQNDGAGFVQPTDWAAFTDERRSHLTETDPGKLADLIETELTVYLDLLAQSDSRWLYGKEFSPTNLAALLLNEVIVHGIDLAGVTGARPPKFEKNEALAAAHAAITTTPLFIDATKAASQPDGVYHVKIRGGKDYGWTKTGSQLSVSEGKPAKADAHLNADPAMFMLSSLGRISQLRAGLSGKMLAYGRKPWRFIGLGTIAVDGI